MRLENLDVHGMHKRTASAKRTLNGARKFSVNVRATLRLGHVAFDALLVTVSVASE